MPPRAHLRDLGNKLLAVALSRYQAARRFATLLQSQQVSGVPGRVIESLSVPLGMFAAVHRFTDEEAILHLQTTIAEWDFGGQTGSDTSNLLAEILGSSVFITPSHKETVSHCLSRPGDSDCVNALLKVGIRRIQRRPIHKHEEVVWFRTQMVMKELLRGGEFVGHQIEQYLTRLKGAKRSQQRIGGSNGLPGIEVPMTTIDDLFRTEPDDVESGEAATASEARPPSGF